MIWEEKTVLDYLRDRRGQRIKTWTVVNAIARQLAGEKYRAYRAQVVPLVWRLIKEGKVVRHRKTDTLRISEIYA